MSSVSANDHRRAVSGAATPLHGGSGAPGQAAAIPAPPLVQVRNLSKTFGATRALGNVSLQFLAGEIHCVLGENGAGKSTLGKIIGGLHGADSGEVLLAGVPVSFQSPRQAREAGVAMVYQELSLAPDLSVRANLWLGAEGARSPLTLTTRAREAALAARTLERLGLDIDPDQRVKDLPVAIQQLIEIGKSLMFAPKVVIFDEPTAMLGAVEKRKYFDVLRALRAQGIASILVTHHIDDVLEVGDRVTVMRNGSVVDSFAMTPEVDGDTILERLTGKRGMTAPAPRAKRRCDTFLEIDGVPTRDAVGRLSAGRGEIVGFYGVVGCGAEAILHGLVGLASGNARSYRLDGRPYRPRSTVDALARGVAYLPPGRARNGILPSRSIRENLMLTQLRWFSRGGVVSAAREQRHAGAMLAECQVKFHDAENVITSLSGGNQQKVLVARAMAAATALLVLEEPTAGVDIEAKHHIHQRIKAIADSGVTVVVMSSDLPETIALCDTVYTMFAGTVIGKYQHPTESSQPFIIADVLGQGNDAAVVAA